MANVSSLTVLIVGSGGREHTLAWACLKSPLVGQVVAAPGNPGMERDGVECVPVSVEDIAGLVALAETKNAGLVIVGPEVPLCLGLVDQLEAKGIVAYGPKTEGAIFEGSKTRTKEFLLKHKIPTGAADHFETVAAAKEYLATASYPIVIKADGLAAGKGVIIAESEEIAHKTVEDMIDGAVFGASGAKVLIEECLFGEETSIHVIVSGKDYVILPTSQDHKQVFEGDKGPNTGGMGAYSPADLIDDALMARIEREIVIPSVNGFVSEGIDFRGTLFIGIMITATGPKVLEYNTRFGDPETQVLITRLETDPVEIMLAAAQGRLGQIDVKVKSEYAICVVLASNGYPAAYPKGEVISLPASTEAGQHIFHAGTKSGPNDEILSNGGRVLGAVGLGANLKEAAASAYALCDKIQFKSKYLRRDIGGKELNRAAR